MVLITLPTYNEEEIIKENSLKVLEFCQKNLKQGFKILIADNGSTDRTLEIAKELSADYKEIDYFHLKEKGRGRALKEAWKNDFDVFIYMDADLSTNLKFLLLLIEEIKNGNDIVVGSRFLKGSKIERGFLREISSRFYNFLLKLFFNLKIKDAQCGFKAVNKKVVKNLLPKVENNGFFFDSELLIRAEKENYKIKEIPIEWKEAKRKSKVNILKTTLNYLKEIIKLKIRLLREDQVKRKEV